MIVKNAHNYHIVKNRWVLRIILLTLWFEITAINYKVIVVAKLDNKNVRLFLRIQTF